MIVSPAVHRSPRTVRTIVVDAPRHQPPHFARQYPSIAPPGPVIDLVSFQLERSLPAAPPAASRLLVRLLLTLALGAFCTWYLQAQKDVTVVDGDRTVRTTTFASSVGSALSRLGVEIGPRDRVVPGVSVRLASGQRIEVLRPRDVVLVLNGQRRQESVTGRNVAEILKELSIASRGALITPAPSTRVKAGGEITVAQSVQATLVHDGKTQSVSTNVLTAGDLLRQLGIVLGPHDRVEPGIGVYPSAGSTIKVVRVKEAVEKVQSKIAFKKVTEKSDKLELGTKKVKTKGVEGVRSTSYRIAYEDGKVRSRTRLGSEVIRPPVSEVTLVGTHRPSVKNPTHSQTGKATWYSQPGLMAAHRTLPFGTVVRVTNLGNGKQVTVTVRDRGPYTGGRIIDLSDTAFKQIAPQSSGVLNVKIEW